MHTDQHFNKKFSFSILGKPITQKRHRHTSTGKYVRTYDPSKDDKAAFLKKCLVQRDPLEYKRIKPLEHHLVRGDYIDMYIEFCFPIPKGTSKKDTADMLAMDCHIKRPDNDNLQKFVLDALNGYFWKDDCIVSNITASKIYSLHPCTNIEIFYRNGLQN